MTRCQGEEISTWPMFGDGTQASLAHSCKVKGLGKGWDS
jgi:hypothetical protein